MRNQRGSILVPVLVVTVIVGILSVLLSSTLVSLLKMNNVLNLQITANLVREKVLQTIENDQAWWVTVNRNGTLHCLLSHNQSCSPGNIILYDAKGQRMTHFDEYGDVCDAASGDCLFAFALRWAPNCSPGTCISSLEPAEIANGTRVARYPAARVQAEMSVNNSVLVKLSRLKDNVPLNPDRYEIPLAERGRDANTLSAACKAVGGIFDQVSETCKLGAAALGTCPPNWIMDGIDANGNRSCREVSVLARKCTTRSAAVGISPGGSLLCGKF